MTVSVREDWPLDRLDGNDLLNEEEYPRGTEVMYRIDQTKALVRACLGNLTHFTGNWLKTSALSQRTVTREQEHWSIGIDAAGEMIPYTTEIYSLAPSEHEGLTWYPLDEDCFQRGGILKHKNISKVVVCQQGANGRFEMLRFTRTGLSVDRSHVLERGPCVFAIEDYHYPPEQWDAIQRGGGAWAG